MAQTQTLIASQTVASDVTGTAFSTVIGEALGVASLSVSAYTADPGYTDPDVPAGLTVVVERRRGSGPWVVAATATVNADTELDLGVDLGDGKAAVDCRARVTLVGVLSAVVALDLEVYSTYASLRDLTNVVREAALDGLTQVERVRAIVGRHDTVDGYVASVYTLPLQTWGEDLRDAEASLAAESLFQLRGCDPTGPDKVIFDAADNARVWLRHISQGRIVPPGITDSVGLAADAEGLGAVVSTSRPSRGW